MATHIYLPEDEMIQRAMKALIIALGPVEAMRFLTLPRQRRLDSVQRHQQWQDNIEALWETMYNAGLGYKGGPVTMSALSGIDMALWDIAGKAANQPCRKGQGLASSLTKRDYAKS